MSPRPLKVGDVVRLLNYDKHGINGYGVVRHLYPDGRIWVSTTNIPFTGTISAVFTRKDLRLENRQ